MIFVKVKLDKSNKIDEKQKNIKKAKSKYDEENKKISESKKKIREEKDKIKVEKKNIKKIKFEKFSKTKLGKFLAKVGSFFRVDRDNYSFGEVFIVTIISLVVGAFACLSFAFVFSGGRNYFVLSKELDKFVEVYETLKNNYYEDIDKELLIEEAINGMVSSVGDEYTNYADSDNADNFNELVDGTYEGIGCTIQLQEHGIVVIEVFDNGPAFKAGLLPGDVIISVDDRDASSMNVDQIAEYIKNESDSKIKMVVLRDGDEKTINLVRAKVETPVVSSAVYERNDKKIGYLSISIFSSVASKQFKDKLVALEDGGIEGLVIDVRNNSGGYLTTVTDILSLLLNKGDIIYQIEKDDKLKPTKDKTFSSRIYPIAVLVNGASASASEIMAAAIKESYSGYVVGTKTFGKGTVQQVKKLSDGSMIKYTIENWLTPDGSWIDGLGVAPTHEVMMETSYYDNPIFENDNQLQKALDLVSE